MGMRILLEALGLTEALKTVQQTEAAVANCWLETKFDEEVGDHYLVWGGRLIQIHARPRNYFRTSQGYPRLQRRH